MSISAGIDQAIAAAPGLLDTPGLALDASASPSPSDFAPALSHSANVTATGQAIADSQAQDDPDSDDPQKPKNDGGVVGFFGHAASWVGHQFQTLPGIHGVEHALGTAATYLSKPLKEIQRDYRFVHEVYAKQGVMAGFLATAGLAGGAALGTVLGGNTAEGIVAAGYLERQLASDGILGGGLQQDSIDSADPNMKISLGRDLASAVGDVPGLHTFGNTNSGFGKILSGGADAIADFTLDPIVMAAKIKTGLKLGEFTSLARDARLGLNTDVVQDSRVLTAARSFLTGDLTRVLHSQNLQAVIDNVAPGLRVASNPEGLATLYGPGENGSGLAGMTYRRFLDHVVAINKASDEKVGTVSKVLHPGDEGYTLTKTLNPGDEGYSSAYRAQGGSEALGSADKPLTVAGTEPQEITTQAKNARPTNSADIARLYPQTANLAFNTVKDNDGNVILKGLASATTRAEAHQVYMDVASKTNFAQRMVDSNVLPTRTMTRAVGQQVAEWMRTISPDTTRAEQPGILAGTATATKQLAKLQPGAAAQTVAATAAGKFRTFTGYKAFAMNKATNALSSDSVPWVHGQGLGPGGYQAWMNVAKYGMGENNARYWLDQLQNAPSLAEAKRITANIKFEAAKGMGLDTDLDYVDAWHKQSISADSAPVGGPGDIYGVGKENGRDVGLMPQGDFQTQQALWAHQTSGDLSFPNFEQMLLSQRQMAGAIKANYGKFDDIAARTYTGPVFKTAALLNAGFALRVSLAEALPQAMRVGVMNHLRSSVAASAAKKKYALDLTHGEDDAVSATVLHALSQSPVRTTGKLLFAPIKAANTGMLHGLNVALNDPARREFAERQVLAHGGHMAIGASTTNEAAGGYGYDNEPATRAAHGAYTVKSEMKNDPRIGYKGTKDFDTFSPTDDVYDGYWHNNLQQLAGQKPAQLIAKDLGATDNKEQAIAGETQRIQAVVDHLTGNTPVEVAPAVPGRNGGFEQRRGAPAPETVASINADKSLTDTEREAKLERLAAQPKPTGSGNVEPAYVAEAHTMTAYQNIIAHNMTAGELAAKRVDAMRGTLYGADGTYHAPLAAKIANGEKPLLSDIDAIPFESRPAQTYGPLRVPFVGPNPIQRIAQFGYAKVLDPMIAHLSRDPIFSQATYDEYQGLKHFVANGQMDEDTAMRLAETRATKAMLPKIHNTALRSQFSVLSRNFMPFYFAQEQALKRAAHLVASNPGALRQYQLVEQGLSDPGFVHTDSSGNKSFIFPGSGVLGQAATALQGTVMGDSVQAGLPMTVSGSMTSLNTVLPELNQPGVSPFLSIPLNKIATMFPELSPLVKDVVGARGFNQSALNALVPSPITKGLSDYIDPDTASASFANAWLNSVASAVYHGQAPGPNATPGEQADFIARMKNNTRSGVLMKMLFGLVSPLAPSVSQGDTAELGFRDEFSADIKKLGYKDALAKFLKDHGTNAISYTVSHSKPEVNGATMPYTQQALDWINENQPLIQSQFGRGAAFLVPQTPGSGDIQTIHSELIRQGLRINETPQDFLNNVDIAMGNAAIGPAYDKHTAFQAAHAGNTAATDAENQMWSDYVDTKGYNNPVWHDYWTSSSRSNDAAQAYRDLVVLFSASGQKGVTLNGKKVDVPSVPDADQSRAVLGLMQDYERHKAALAGEQGNFAGDSAARKQEKANWAKFLADKSNSDQTLSPVIQAVFSRLDATGV